MARYNADGTLDQSFGTYPPGRMTTDFSSLGFTTESAVGLIRDANGRLIVAGTASQSGYSSFAVCCYDPGPGSVVGLPINDVPPVLNCTATRRPGRERF